MNNTRGFTLIEIIIGIVVIAIVTLVVTAGMGPLFRQSVDPWQQVRAAELGQSLMNEIMARRFDDNNVGNVRCGEGAVSCTNTPTDCDGPGNPLPNAEAGETRQTFDDVDDFNCLGINVTGITNILGDSLDATFYQGFNAEIRVTRLTPDQLKNISVTIITPQAERIVFSSQRGNW